MEHSFPPVASNHSTIRNFLGGVSIMLGGGYVLSLFSSESLRILLSVAFFTVPLIVPGICLFLYRRKAKQGISLPRHSGEIIAISLLSLLLGTIVSLPIPKVLSFATGANTTTGTPIFTPILEIPVELELDNPMNNLLGFVSVPSQKPTTKPTFTQRPTANLTMEQPEPIMEAPSPVEPAPQAPAVELPAPQAPAVEQPAPAMVEPAPQQIYYKNCDAVRAAGKAPLYAGSPGYRAELDRNSDGVACESP